LFLGGFALTALPILAYSNLVLFWEIVTLNSELEESERGTPTESRFLSLLFFIVAFMITITAFIFTFASCCYCCCLAAWLSAVKARNRNENVRGEPVIDPNLDPADRAAIEAALRDIDRAQA